MLAGNDDDAITDQVEENGQIQSESSRNEVMREKGGKPGAVGYRRNEFPGKPKPGKDRQQKPNTYDATSSNEEDDKTDNRVRGEHAKGARPGACGYGKHEYTGRAKSRKYRQQKPNIYDATYSDEEDDKTVQHPAEQFMMYQKAGSHKRTSMKESATESKYEFFYGKTSPFSQFHAARFVVDGITYNCMEQYMHHQKAVTFKDEAIAKQILASKNPIEHEKLGTKVSNFDKDVWNKLSVEIVIKGNEAKFSQNEDLKKALFDTGDKILAEASPRDRIWGIGLGASNPKAQDCKNWRGKNKLGYALTEVRERLKKKSDKILTKD